jgi:hypothetical protein
VGDRLVYTLCAAQSFFLNSGYQCALIALDSLLDHVSNPELIFLGKDSQVNRRPPFRSKRL